MIIFYILTTLSLDNVWTLLGENCCWSLLGLKGLTHSSVRKLKGLHLHVTKIRCVLLSVPDPDLQIGGKGGGGVGLKIFRPSGPQFGIKLSW